MKLNSVTNQMVLLWIPVVIFFCSIYFLWQGKNGLVVGVILLGFALDGFVEFKLKDDAYEKDDERYRYLIRKGTDFSHRMTYSAIIVLLIIHFLYHSLEAGFVLILLLVISYASASFSTLFFSFRH